MTNLSVACEWRLPQLRFGYHISQILNMDYLVRSGKAILYNADLLTHHVSARILTTTLFSNITCNTKIDYRILYDRVISRLKTSDH